MEVRLAGFNVDRDLLEEIRDCLAEFAAGRGDVDRARELLENRVWSPETISAAYARISRSPKPVGELRADARREVTEARRSNRRIIFKMGHSSIAEHSTFNFDLLGLSRLAAEQVESHRLCSFTEKSQRYVVLDPTQVPPEEVRGTPAEPAFRRLIARQGELYQELLEELAGGGPPDESSKEDSRYALPLAAETQLGMTLNARSLALMLRRLAASPLQECRDLSRALFREVDGLAPSVIRYVEPGEDDRFRPPEMDRIARDRSSGCDGGGSEPVSLLEWTPDPDRSIHRALLGPGSGLDAGCFREHLAHLPEAELADDLRRSLAHLEAHEPAPRAFEAASFTFQVVLSAAAFAQLKRHRMATLLAGPYELDLGIVVPHTVERIGAGDRLWELARAAEPVHQALSEIHPDLGSYALTNAHRRRILLRMNARELYHLARLRMDRHAQWEIRELATRMVALAREQAPHALCLACGKDGFQEERRRVTPDST